MLAKPEELVSAVPMTYPVVSSRKEITSPAGAPVRVAERATVVPIGAEFGVTLN